MYSLDDRVLFLTLGICVTTVCVQSDYGFIVDVLFTSDL